MGKAKENEESDLQMESTSSAKRGVEISRALRGVFQFQRSLTTDRQGDQRITRRDRRSLRRVDPATRNQFLGHDRQARSRWDGDDSHECLDDEPHPRVRLWREVASGTSHVPREFISTRGTLS